MCSSDLAEGGNPSRERWAARADEMRTDAEAAVDGGLRDGAR